MVLKENGHAWISANGSARVVNITTFALGEELAIKKEGNIKSLPSCLDN